MAKTIYFERLVGKGEATSPLDGTVNKWFTVELTERNGVMRNRVKTNFWGNDIDESELLALKAGQVWGKGDIVTKKLPAPIMIGENVVSSMTIFVKEGVDVDTALAKKLAGATFVSVEKEATVDLED